MVWVLIRCASQKALLISTQTSTVGREIAGLSPGRVIPKTLKMVIAVCSLGSRARNWNWSAQCQYNLTGWNSMSSVLGVIFQ